MAGDSYDKDRVETGVQTPLLIPLIGVEYPEDVPKIKSGVGDREGVEGLNTTFPAVDLIWANRALFTSSTNESV